MVPLPGLVPVARSIARVVPIASVAREDASVRDVPGRFVALVRLRVVNGCARVAPIASAVPPVRAPRARA